MAAVAPVCKERIGGALSRPCQASQIDGRGEPRSRRKAEDVHRAVPVPGDADDRAGQPFPAAQDLLRKTLADHRGRIGKTIITDGSVIVSPRRLVRLQPNSPAKSASNPEMPPKVDQMAMLGVAIGVRACRPRTRRSPPEWWHGLRSGQQQGPDRARSRNAQASLRLSSVYRISRACQHGQPRFGRIPPFQGVRQAPWGITQHRRRAPPWRGLAWCETWISPSP